MLLEAITNPPSRRRSPSEFIKTGITVLLWTVVILAALRFFNKYAVHYFLRFSEDSYHDFWPKRIWLLLHICGAAIALFLGPLQFWSGVRRRYMRLHRWLGRIYLLGVALGLTGGFYLALHQTLGWTYGVALFSMASAWLLTSLMAYVAIRGGQVKAHKEWMIRSYILTFAFVTSRIPDDIPALANLGTPTELAATAVWISWVAPLLMAEVILQLRQTVRASIRKKL